MMDDATGMTAKHSLDFDNTLDFDAEERCENLLSDIAQLQDNANTNQVLSGFWDDATENEEEDELSGDVILDFEHLEQDDAITELVTDDEFEEEDAQIFNMNDDVVMDESDGNALFPDGSINDDAKEKLEEIWIESDHIEDEKDDAFALVNDDGAGSDDIEQDKELEAMFDDEIVDEDIAFGNSMEFVMLDEEYDNHADDELNHEFEQEIKQQNKSIDRTSIIGDVQKKITMFEANAVIPLASMDNAVMSNDTKAMDQILNDVLDEEVELKEDNNLIPLLSDNAATDTSNGMDTDQLNDIWDNENGKSNASIASKKSNKKPHKLAKMSNMKSKKRKTVGPDDDVDVQMRDDVLDVTFAVEDSDEDDYSQF